MSTQQNAFGNALFSEIPRGTGPYRTEFGTLLQPATSMAAYVRSTGVQDGDDEIIQNTLVKDLNSALLRVRSGLADFVYVLPGHSENISTADQMSGLRAGTKIIGVGHGDLRPKFTWTATAASFLFDQANVELSNCILNMASAANAGVTVTTPITVSAAGCAIRGCRINFGDDANDKVGQAINTTADADDFVFEGNECYGATAAECETFLNLIGTDRVRIVGNYISGATSAVAVGLIRVETTAPKDIYIGGNYVANNKAASVQAITLLASTTGFMGHQNHLAVLDDTTLNLVVTGDITLDGTNTFANTTGERGAVMGTVSA